MASQQQKGVYRIPKAGGAATRLAEWSGGPTRLAVGPSDVYYLTYDGFVTVVPKGGGEARRIDRAAGVDLAVAGGVAYLPRGWPGADDHGRYAGRVQALPLAGGAPIDLAANEDGAFAVAVDETDVYFTSRPHVARVPRAGGAVKVLGSGPGEVTRGPNVPMLFGMPYLIAVDRDHVYVDLEAADITLVAIPKRGGDPQTLAHLPSHPSRIAADGEHVYLTVREAEGGTFTLWRLRASGGGLEPVASGLLGPPDIAVDATHLAWTNGDQVWWGKRGEAAQLHARP